MEYIKELLKDYETDPLVDSATLGKENIMYKYIFSSDKNEELIIITRARELDKTEKISSISYTCEKDEKTSISMPIRLSFSNIEDTSSYYVSYKTDDIIEFKKISEIIDDKDSLLLDTYNKVAEDMLTENNLTLKDIEELINTKPTPASYVKKFGNKEYEISRDRYTNGDYRKGDYEDMTFAYMDDENKFSSIVYDKTNNDTNMSLLKSTSIYHDNINKVYSNISLPINNISEQEKLLNKILEL